MVFYLVLFCIHVCADDVIEEKSNNNNKKKRLEVLIELIFRFIFQFSIFILRVSSKRCLSFSYFSTVFEKSAITSRQELLFNHILKECLISNDLQIIRK